MDNEHQPAHENHHRPGANDHPGRAGPRVGRYSSSEPLTATEIDSELMRGFGSGWCADFRSDTGGASTVDFVHAVRRAGAKATTVTLEAVAAELLARWSEPHRYYHNVDHLADCLRQVSHEPIVALAAWGHDAVYDPRSARNEERSALLMTELLWRCQVPASNIAEVARLIRAYRRPRRRERRRTGRVAGGS